MLQRYCGKIIRVNKCVIVWLLDGDYCSKCTYCVNAFNFLNNIKSKHNNRTDVIRFQVTSRPQGYSGELQRNSFFHSALGLSDSSLVTLYLTTKYKPGDLLPCRLDIDSEHWYGSCILCHSVAALCTTQLVLLKVQIS